MSNYEFYECPETTVISEKQIRPYFNLLKGPLRVQAFLVTAKKLTDNIRTSKGANISFSSGQIKIGGHVDGEEADGK